jgi:glycosyltransferase involved in cell wall biosynthesis
VFFRLARVFLNPGLVGLGILDCFAAGLPFVTSPDAKHSPEIAYLDDGVNGMFVKGGPKEYASAVSQLLKDDAKLQKLRSGALMSSQRYTVENMVQNVASGILSCLEISASGTQNRETKDS